MCKTNKSINMCKKHQFFYTICVICKSLLNKDLYQFLTINRTLLLLILNLKYNRRNLYEVYL
jgi:hypothetical protein